MLRSTPKQSVSVPDKPDIVAFYVGLALTLAAPADAPINPSSERHTSCRHVPSLRTRPCAYSSPRSKSISSAKRPRSRPSRQRSAGTSPPAQHSQDLASSLWLAPVSTASILGCLRALLPALRVRRTLRTGRQPGRRSGPYFCTPRRRSRGLLPTAIGKG
jgi:hypothetical protein